MISTARARTAGLAGGRHILAIQDTTTLRDDGNQRSLNLHAMIAVDADDGGLLGLVDAVFLKHVGGKKGLRKKLPFSEKESRRWLDTTHTAARLIASGAACVTVVADRECEIYEEFACRPAETELVIRANHDRCLEGGGRLYECLKTVSELGRETIELPANPGRLARKAVLALRTCEITLKRPQSHKGGHTVKLPETVTLTLVEAREIDPPAGEPKSALTCWFKERIAQNSGRLKKPMIVALARKLLVALWKYVSSGVVIEGAIMKNA